MGKLVGAKWQVVGGIKPKAVKAEQIWLEAEKDVFVEIKLDDLPICLSTISVEMSLAGSIVTPYPGLHSGRRTRARLSLPRTNMGCVASRSSV